MKILYLLKHNPWDNGGGNFACKAYMTAFAEVFREAEFTYLVCSEYLGKVSNLDKSSQYVGIPERNKFEKILMPLSGKLCRHYKLAKDLITKNSYDIVIFDHSYLAGCLVEVAKKYRCKTITIHHNYELEYFKDNHGKLATFLLSYQISRNERKAFVESDYNILLTRNDLNSLSQHYGESKGVNGVIGCFDINMKQHDFTPIKPKTKKVVITGSIGNVQNLESLNDFISNYLPHLDSSWNITIAGRNAPDFLYDRIKDFPNVNIINNPPTLDDIVGDASVFLCPSNNGSGIKIRVMDGLRMGLPVVAHYNSSRGYEAFIESSSMLTYRNVDEFLSCLNKIASMSLDETLALHARIYNDYSVLFSLQNGIAKIKQLLDI